MSACEREGMKYIAVTLNDPDDWNNHMKMYDYAYANSKPVKAVEKDEVIRRCDDGTFVAEEDFIIPSLKSEKTDVEVVVNIPQKIDKPINKYEKVGYLSIIYNEKEIGRVNIISDSDMYGNGEINSKKSFIIHLKNLFLRFSV